MPVSPTGPAAARVVHGLPSARRGLIGAITLLVLLAGTGGLLLLREQEKQARERTEDVLDALSTGQAALFADQVRERVGDAGLLASRDVVRRALSPAGTPAFREAERRRLPRAISQTAAAYGYRNVIVLDTALVQIAALIDNDDERRFVTEPARDALRTDAPVVVPVHRGADGTLRYGVAAPVREAAGGRLLGAVYLSVLAQDGIFPNLARQRRLGSSLNIELLQRDGDALEMLWAEPAGEDFRLAERRVDARESSAVATRALARGGDTVIRGVDIHGVEVVAHVSPVAGADWFVIAKIDRDEAESVVRTGRRVVLALFGLLALAAAALARALWADRKRQSAETEARLAERAERVVQTSLDGFVVLDAEGRILQVNDAVCHMTGYSQEELLARGLGDLKVLAPGESVPKTLERIRLAVGGTHFTSRWRRKGGAVIDIDVSARHLADEGGLVYAFIRDTTDDLVARRRLERLNRVHTMLSAASEAMQQAGTPSEAYDALARCATVHGDFPLAWVGEVHHDTRSVEPVATAGERAPLIHVGVALDPALPTGQTATARCIREQLPVVYADFQTNAATAAFHAMAREVGVFAVAAFPVMVDAAPRAALTLLSTDPEYFQPDIVALLGESTRFLSSVLQSMQAAEEQRTEEERFRQLFEGSPLPMAVVDRSTQRILRVNRTYTEVLGWRVEEIPTVAAAIERHFPDPTARAEAARNLDADLKRLSPEVPTLRSPTVPQRCRDGSDKYMQVLSTQVGDEIILAWVDLTEVRQNRLLLDRAQSIARLVSWDYDFAQDRLHFAAVDAASPAAERNGSGLDWLFRGMEPEEERQARVTFQLAAGEGTKLDLTTKHRDADGGVRYRRSRIEFERAALGLPLRAVGSSQDVTDETMVALELEQHRRNLEQLVEARTSALQRAYEQVAESDQRFSFAMEASSEGIWDWDVPTHTVTYSSVYQRILGYEPGELASDARGGTGLTHPDDRERVVRSLHALFAHDEARTIEFRIRRKDGTYLWVESTGKVVERLPDGTARRVIGTLSDLSERRAADDALRAAKESADEANRAKSSFLAVMSHEIRTPLNGVIGMAEVLTQSPLPAREAETVRIILNSAGSLLGLIDDILDFSKIEAGKLELELVDTDLGEVVEGVTAALGPVAHAKRVALSTYIAPAIPAMVVTDGTRLRQIIYNLVGNAIKFSGDREGRTGRVALRLECTDVEPRALRIVVRDDGVGIPAATQARLFTSFMQAESSTTRRFGGTGLGLAICKRLATLFGGDIAVASTEGMGSTFTVTIPMEASTVQPARDLADIAGLDCVVVHDAGDGDEADDITGYLEAGGAHVRAAASEAAAEALARGLAAPVIVIAPAPLGDDTGGVPDDDRVRYVRITHGQGRTARVVTPSLALLDRFGLRQRSLALAVAVAAGRASPELIETAPQEMMTTGATPLGIDEARAQGRLILVAEDDEVNQKVILRQLELIGYAAEVAANGAEALALWRTRRYAMVLTDLHMPGMDGYQLTEAIRRAEAPGARIPIAALTANALRGEEVRARELGMDDYLTKPIRLRDLKQSLERLLPHTATARTSGEQPSMPDPTVPLDLTVLTHLIGDHPEFTRQILGDFRERATQSAEEARSAVAADDLAEVARVMHRLKSAARSVGALPLGEDCARVEQAAKRQEGAVVRQLLEPFERELAAVLEAVDRAAAAA